MPCFCSHSSEVAAGFLISLYLLVHNLPQLCMHAVIFSVLEFLCLVLLEEMFVWIRALQGRVPGPRSQPVSLAPCSLGWDTHMAWGQWNLSQKSVPHA